jgi:hypothetical protein
MHLNAKTQSPSSDTTGSAPAPSVSVPTPAAAAKPKKAERAMPSRPMKARAAKTASGATAKSPAAKTGAKKAAAKPAATPSKTAMSSKAEKVQRIEKPEKPDKARKPKLVRDSFTIPKLEYQVLEALKQRAVQLAQPAKKSELLRAGIKALAALSDTDFRAALAAVPAIKTGRPAGTPAD